MLGHLNEEEESKTSARSIFPQILAFSQAVTNAGICTLPSIEEIKTLGGRAIAAIRLFICKVSVY